MTFLLPANKYPKDFPYGNDLDNLCKRLFDALRKTIFSDARGKDSCVIALHVMKTKFPPNGQSGGGEPPLSRSRLSAVSLRAQRESTPDKFAERDRKDEPY